MTPLLTSLLSSKRCFFFSNPAEAKRGAKLSSPIGAKKAIISSRSLLLKSGLRRMCSANDLLFIRRFGLLLRVSFAGSEPLSIPSRSLEGKRPKLKLRSLKDLAALPAPTNPLLKLLLTRCITSLPFERMRPRSSLRRRIRAPRLLVCGLAARAALRAACFCRRASRAYVE